MAFPKGHKSYWTEETKKKYSREHSGVNNSFYGKKHSKQAIEKNRIAHIGKPSNKGQKRYDIIGEKHFAWKGDKVGYEALHTWVSRRLGKPNHCAVCQTTEAKRFAWANISHSYKRDLSDWIRLCYSCHKLYDLGKIKI